MKKTLSFVLVFALLLSVLSMSALAVSDLNSLDVVDTVNIESITVTGGNVQSVIPSSAASNNGYAENTTYTYDIVLSGETASNAAITVTFEKADTAGPRCVISAAPRISQGPTPTIPVVLNNQSLTYTANLVSGVGSTTAYVFPDLNGNGGFIHFDTYVFNITTGTVKNPVSYDGIMLRFGDPDYAFTDPECYMSFEGSNGSYNVTYNGQQTNYYPSALSLYALAGASSITAINVTGGVTVQPTYIDGDGEMQPTNNVASGYYMLTINATGTATFVRSGHQSITLNFTVPTQSGGIDTEVYAYVPAPGQFPNEGAGTGGWGDAFVSGSTGVKHMVGNVVSTGVSLGYFGGYVVFDMGEDIANTATNPYGVDFVVYGNAFAGNSEPGCVQVARDANHDGKPDAWFNIAGSLHYDADTIWNASYTYTNPTPADDVTTSYPTAGTINSNGVPYTYSHTARPGATATTGSGIVTYNTFHQHSWFPLYANYFIGRGNVNALDKIGVLSFASYNRDTTNGSTLTLTGVMLGDAQNTQTAAYTFGYADVHPNGSANGVAANPYAAGQSTTGGDGIDISWAVNANGHPVNLPDIRFVRVYTGAAKMNGIFGEISTEVCGVIKATGTGSGASNDTITVKENGTALTGINNMGTKTISKTAGTTCSYEITSSADRVFVNGQAVSSPHSFNITFTAGTTQYCQIITQSGDRSPFVTLIKFVA